MNPLAKSSEDARDHPSGTAGARPLVPTPSPAERRDGSIRSFSVVSPDDDPEDEWNPESRRANHAPLTTPDLASTFSRSSTNPSSLTQIQFRLLRSELDSLRRQRDDARRQYRALQDHYEALTRTLVSPSRLKLLRAELESLRRQRDDARNQVRRLQEVCERLQRLHDHDQAALTASQEWRRQRDEAMKEAARLRSVLQELSRTSLIPDDLVDRGDYERLQEQLQAARAELERLRHERRRLQETTVPLHEYQLLSERVEMLSNQLHEERAKHRDVPPPHELENLKRDREILRELVASLVEALARRLWTIQPSSELERRRWELQLEHLVQPDLSWEERLAILATELHRLLEVRTSPGRSVRSPIAPGDGTPPSPTRGEPSAQSAASSRQGSSRLAQRPASPLARPADSELRSAVRLLDSTRARLALLRNEYRRPPTS